MLIPLQKKTAMIRTLIIEDEPAVRKEIEFLVNQEHDLNLLGTASNVKDALVLIRATEPQLILMDIQLTDGTAFDILDQLNEIKFQVIFITAYNHFAIKAIKYGSLDYLLKPLDENELRAAVQKVISQQTDLMLQNQKLQILKGNQHLEERNMESRMVLSTQESIQVIQLKDIVYCQSEGGYTWFFLANGQKVLISKPLKFYDELLPEDCFLRPHQSYLVNIIYVDKYLKVGDLILKDKTEISGLYPQERPHRPAHHDHQMMNRILFTLLILSVFGCQRQSSVEPANSTRSLLTRLKHDSDSLKKNPDLNVRLAFWYKKLHTPRYANDSVLSSKIHYSIAGIFYASNEIDSLKAHMQQAWELMEHQAGYEDEQVLLYYGLGNVAHAEQKIHQENHYYNQAAQMLIADTSISITPKQKLMVFFAAGQSCDQLRLVDNAIKMNRQALAILPQLPDDDASRFRAYSQMANAYYHMEKNTDSLFTYINKMVSIYLKAPDTEKARFIYDRKSTYFERIGQIDSCHPLP